MTKKILLPVAGVIILLHLVVILLLIRRSAPTPSSAPKETETPAVASSKNNAPAPTTAIPTATPAPTAVGSPAAVQQPPRPPATWADPLPYSADYFTKKTVPLPQKLQQAAALCKAGIAVDLSSRQILWAKNETTPLTIASLTKMMTTFLAVRKMRQSGGQITLQTMVPVTRESSQIGGRQVWLDPREKFSVDDLLKCALVHSANDATYLMAQYFGGTESHFVQEMNQYAKELGCTHFRFINAHGLPERQMKNDENYGTAIELAYLADQLLAIPEITKWCGTKNALLRENDEAFIKRNKGKPLQLQSSNPLLGHYPGCNGMKTGLTDRSGFCLVATASRQGKNVCLVLLGCRDKKTRNTLAFGLMNLLFQ